MSEATSPRLPKPEALLQLSPSAHAVVEASAGTGKTYTLEHIVVDLILAEEARIGEILVVTFTEKAAFELKRRVRERIRALSRLERTDTMLSPEQCWVIDEGARQRLESALVEFDSARIETIHAFCHTVLLENPFPSGVLFTQELVDERELHGRAFRDVLENVLLTDSTHWPFLAAWLEEEGRSVDALEELLFEASRAHALLGRRWDQAGFADALRALSSLPSASGGLPAGTRKQVAALRRAIEAETDAARLARLDRVDLGAIVEQIPELEGVLRPLATCAVPLSAVLVERFAPLVESRRLRLAREEGWFDYDDLLKLVARSLETAPELALALRNRFRYVLIDECQDTDSRQWRIFERIVFESKTSAATSRARLVGDPKQAIYGFRGADVQVYLRAKSSALSGGTLVHLVDSYRATPRLVDALNVIFDPSAKRPFFDGPIRPERPLRAGDSSARLIDVNGEEVSPVVLLEHDVRDRAPLADLMAREIQGRIGDDSRRLVLARDGKEEPVEPQDVFVLTRTHREAVEAAEALRRHCVPYTFYRQEGLFQSAEARHLLDLLTAIEEPSNRSKRFRAWLTPFFGLTVEELTRGEEAPAEHPLSRWLADWNVLAESQDYERLFESVLERTGVLRREIFRGEGERGGINYRHIVEVLLEELQGKNVTLGELRQRLASYVRGSALPSGRDANVMRRESENAVSIMTVHAAKGLEAALVFVYAFSPGRTAQVQVYYEGDERRMHVGRKSRAPEAIALAIEREEREEYQRLLYVALTRAKARLYLPLLSGKAKTRGCYGQLNDRLEVVGNGDVFERIAVPAQPESVEPRIADVAAIASFRSRQSANGLQNGATFAALRRHHAGLELTSYSRIKALSGGYHPPEPAPGVVSGPALSPPADRLPGGTATGTLLHEILEAVELAGVRESSDLDSWRARGDVTQLIGRALRRRGVDRAHREEIESLVYRAVTTPFTLDRLRLDSGLAGLDHDRVLREVAFVFPSGDSERARPPTGFVEGSIDVLFEYRGRVYLCDWKSDVLPSWTDALVQEHVERNYRVQIELYTLAVTRMIDATTEEAYAARFGGVLYCFLRGLPEQAPYFERPSWKDLVRWREEYGA